MKKVLFFLFFFSSVASIAQIPDHIYGSNIAAVKLYRVGDMYSYPILRLNSTDQLQLLFDDLDGDSKNYYYTYELCNADWSPSNMQPFDYIKGFQTVRIGTYRYSSIAITRYTNYQAVIPDPSCIPTHSGNYLLKVFLNSDTSKLAFTKRFLVVDNKASIAAQVTQPFNGQLSRTHQRVQVQVTTNSQVRSIAPQDLRLVILQNNIWLTSTITDHPTIFRGNYYEYTDEDKTTFEGGKEWRWLDLRSLRLLSDRMQRMVDSGKTVHVFVKPDGNRQQQAYLYYTDLDGIFTIETTDNINPFWQSDYSYVHFSFSPANHQALAGQNVYLFGELTNYADDESSKMTFDPDKGVYEKTLFLKQGYYNYSYVTLADKKDEPVNNISYQNTEGNYTGTENKYTILVYYRPFGARADELIGYTMVSSYLQGQ